MVNTIAVLVHCNECGHKSVCSWKKVFEKETIDTGKYAFLKYSLTCQEFLMGGIHTPHIKTVFPEQKAE